MKLPFFLRLDRKPVIRIWRDASGRLLYRCCGRGLDVLGADPEDAWTEWYARVFPAEATVIREIHASHRLACAVRRNAAFRRPHPNAEAGSQP